MIASAAKDVKAARWPISKQSQCRILLCRARKDWWTCCSRFKMLPPLVTGTWCWYHITPVSISHTGYWYASESTSRLRCSFIGQWSLFGISPSYSADDCHLANNACEQWKHSTV